MLLRPRATPHGRASGRRRLAYPRHPRDTRWSPGTRSHAAQQPTCGAPPNAVSPLGTAGKTVRSSRTNTAPHWHCERKQRCKRARFEHADGEWRADGEHKPDALNKADREPGDAATTESRLGACASAVNRVHTFTQAAALFISSYVLERVQICGRRDWGSPWAHSLLLRGGGATMC
eukprot:scaffold7307_cov125-Isochrysis_galbana.AAC.10